MFGLLSHDIGGLNQTLKDFIHDQPSLVPVGVELSFGASMLHDAKPEITSFY